MLGAMNHVTGTTANYIHISCESHHHRNAPGYESADDIQWMVTEFLRPQLHVALSHSFLIIHMCY